MHFELHPNLLKKDCLLDLPLCRVLLENESNYPWILLVPRRPSLSKMMDLSMEDQIQLTKEVNLAQNVIWNSSKLDQLNTAAIGNKTPQLHVHVIGRRETDPAWPNTVWDHPLKCEYTPDQKSTMILLLRYLFSRFNHLI